MKMESLSFDSYLLLEPASYYYATGKTRWHLASADELAALLQSAHPPELRTVLGITGDMSDPPESWCYLGPLYFDFDGPIDETIAGFHALLAVLDKHGVDLEAIRLFATGGRGFHVEVPMPHFAPSNDGVEGLPYVYREMANMLRTDCMDLVIYSGKSGRMWRVPNCQRDNGMYKVPLSVAEALSVTPERYAELCSKPRPFPPLTAPQYSPEMSALFESAKAKVATQGMRKADRHANAELINAELVHRFGGKLPPTLAALGQGVFPARGGWNRVAMQMAIAAHAVGMSEGALIEACAGLIEVHASDGRYNSPARRRAELSAQFDYCSERGYEFSTGGVYSILPQGLYARDMKGL